MNNNRGTSGKPKEGQGETKGKPEEKQRKTTGKTKG